MITEAQIKLDVQKNYPPWANISADKIKIQQMVGITNLTFKVSAEGDDQALIYRHFGESSQNIFLSREQQTHVYQALSNSGDGPKIYYYDQRIRLQQFLDSKLLKGHQMLLPGYLEQVAFSLSHFHQTKPESQFIRKQSFFRKTFIDNKQKMLSICQNKLKKDIYTVEEQQIVDLLKTWVTQDQINFVQKVVAKYQQEPLVFSHNDLLVNNILIRNDNGQFVFIDYQYASFNYPFFDMANYFQESLIDYDVLQPPYFKILQPSQQNPQMKIRFLDAYVISKDYSRQQCKLKFEQLRKQPKYIQQRQKLLGELSIGRMLCSLFWGWWAIIVSKNPLINFDYIVFAKWRYNNYQQEKKNLIK